MRMNDEELPIRPDPTDLPSHSKDGVDLTLIRWMLSLTPSQRLEVLEKNIAGIMRLRGDKSS